MTPPMYPHWYYFVTLVDDLERASRYVEISRENFNAYSIEFARILLAASSEIDVVAKVLCSEINPKAKAQNIEHYCKIITTKYPTLPMVVVEMPRYELEFTPWESWSRKDSPAWWKSYNKVKHQRDKHFSDANLESTLNAVGALCILVCHLYHTALGSHKLNPVPRFLKLGTQYGFGNALIGTPCYCLPDFPQPEGKWVLKGKQQFRQMK